MVLRIMPTFTALLMLAGAGWAQSLASPCTRPVEYENHNQVDYGPFILQSISGHAIVEVGEPARKIGPARGVCLAVFTEEEHRRVATGITDEEANFRFDALEPGDYRLVARAEGLCVANVRIRIVRNGRNRGHRRMVLHLTPASIDRCSYGEYK